MLDASLSSCRQKRELHTEVMCEVPQRETFLLFEKESPSKKDRSVGLIHLGEDFLSRAR